MPEFHEINGPQARRELAGIDVTAVLQSRPLNGWWLFAIVTVPLSILVGIRATSVDLSMGAGVSEMIGFSVRLAVPFIYLAMAASSIQVLFPGEVGKWWVRNRPYIGLCFAAGMAWQALFIFILSTMHRDYYLSQVYYFRDEIEGSVGYIFLAAMVVTSFRFARRRLDQQQWKIIHTGGIYFLWGYAFSVYWWNLHYYENPRTLDYIYYWAGFLAFALRIAAWGKKRVRKSGGQTDPTLLLPLTRAAGVALIIAGMLLAPTGLQWQAAVTGFLTTPTWSAQMELWLPFWPLEPFLSLLLIAAGTAIITRTGARTTAVDSIARTNAL